MGLGLTLTLLTVAGIASVFVSDWFINGLEPAISILHISQAFAGLVIVAIAGNAAENTAGLVLAYKGRSDLAISVVKNSVAQIAAFLFPLLVLVSFLASYALFDHAHLNAAVWLVYPPQLYLVARMLWIGTRGRGRAPGLPAWMSLRVLTLCLVSNTAMPPSSNETTSPNRASCRMSPSSFSRRAILKDVMSNPANVYPSQVTVCA